MKLYNGSLVAVNKPEIRETSHTLDYGKGFYTTTSYEQTKAWVKRKNNEKNCGRTSWSTSICSIPKLPCNFFISLKQRR